MQVNMIQLGAIVFGAIGVLELRWNEPEPLLLDGIGTGIAWAIVGALIAYGSGYLAGLV